LYFETKSTLETEVAALLLCIAINFGTKSTLECKVPTLLLPFVFILRQKILSSF
jgi:hypothetical protein